MEKYTDSSFHELTKHGTNEFPFATYGDSYKVCKDRFYYSHYHEELEIIYARRNDIDVIVNDTEYHLDEGESLLINSNNIHRICHSEYPESTVVSNVFSNKLIRLPIPDILDALNKRYEAIPIKDNKINQTIWRMILSGREKENGYQLSIISNIFEVFSYIYSNYNELKPIESNNKNNDRIRQALSFIKSNYNNQITLSDISKECYLSEGETIRLFNKYIGDSPINYLINYRINVATTMLLNEDMSITDIATSTGFSSSNYFTIAFKKITGMTPKEYKKKKGLLRN